MSLQMKIDFYRVEMPEGATSTFESVLRTVSQLPNDEQRNVAIRDHHIRLQESHFGSECIEGDMLRVRMHALPPKASLSGEVEALRLEDDEGLGEETAFLYVPINGVLVLQRNRFGVSASTFAHYFEITSLLDQPIRLDPILGADAYSRLAKMKEVRRLKVRFAGVTNHQIFKKNAEDEGVGSMIDTLNYFHAPSATMIFSMGHQPGSLFQRGIDKMYRRIVTGRDDSGQVEKIEITGITEDDERDIFDLLGYRMLEFATVDENSKRRTTYRRRRPELLDAWKRRRAELARLYVS